MKKKTKHRHEPDLAKAARQFYREQAYAHLVRHQSIPHVIIHLVRNGCPIRTASLLIDWVIIHSFGDMVLH